MNFKVLTSSIKPLQKSGCVGDIGVLCGLYQKNTPTTADIEVFTFIKVQNGNEDEIEGHLERITSIIPQGIKVLGVYEISTVQKLASLTFTTAIGWLLSHLQNLDSASEELLKVTLCRGTGITGSSGWSVDLQPVYTTVDPTEEGVDDRRQNVPLAQLLIDSSRLMADLICFRVTARIPIITDAGRNNSQTVSGALSAVERVDVAAPAFHIAGTDVILESAAPGDAQHQHNQHHSTTGGQPPTIAGAMSCQLLRQHVRRQHAGGGSGAVVASNIDTEVYEARLMRRVSNRVSGSTGVAMTVPVVDYEKRDKVAVYPVTVRLDTVVYVEAQTVCVHQLTHLFSSALARQLSLITRNMSDTASGHADNHALINQSGDVLCLPTPHMFLPASFQHPVIILYCDNTDNHENTVSESKWYQEMLYIDAAKLSLQPMFAVNAPKVVDTKSVAENHLRNVHSGCPPSGVDGGVSHIAEGTYLYYHYLQDGMDDNGWGCAYRSLQTICSWFREQCYVTRPVPTHRQIQQALVDLEDKPATFVGSKQWIGSMEVGFVLNHLFKVESKYIYITSGSELADKGREIAQHFDTQGTPIMIGGGVLAHTILGVDFNDQSGDVSYLVLDPHYTGQDYLTTIHSKGWCGWKPVTFWDQASFYNLCLPQLPTTSD